MSCQAKSHGKSTTWLADCAVQAILLLSLPLCAHRYALLGGCALFQGATLGPLVNAVLASQPGLLIAAFLGTSAVFACFSLAALMSRRRR